MGTFTFLILRCQCFCVYFISNTVLLLLTQYFHTVVFQEEEEEEEELKCFSSSATLSELTTGSCKQTQKTACLVLNCILNELFTYF